MKTISSLLLIFFFFISDKVLSQESVENPPKQTEKIKPLAADRPDQTETPAIVPVGMFQMENGFIYENITAGESSVVSPTILFKYGVSENLELRLITEYTTDKIADEKISGLHPVLVGFKVNLAEEKGIIPQTSFIGHLLIPDLASKNFKADYYATEFRFTMQHTLSDKISLGYNLGAEWDGVTPQATFVYTLTSGYAFTEKFGGFIEVYGFAPQEDKPDHRFDGGMTYLISNDFMVDLSGGFGITENAPDYFLSAGFSFRL